MLRRMRAKKGKKAERPMSEFRARLRLDNFGSEHEKSNGGRGIRTQDSWSDVTLLAGQTSGPSILCNRCDLIRR